MWEGGLLIYGTSKIPNNFPLVKKRAFKKKIKQNLIKNQNREHLALRYMFLCGNWAIGQFESFLCGNWAMIYFLPQPNLYS